MKIDGIWKVEFLGPYGWEALSTAFLENGRYLSASQDHFAIGRYETNDDYIRVDAMTHPHAGILDSSTDHPAQQFGFDGQINGDHISGQADDSEDQQSMTIRGTRLGDIP